MASSYELTDIGKGRPFTPRDDERITEATKTGTGYDRAALNRIGKNPVLKRNFGFLSILSFSSTALICWESVTILLDQGLKNGGPSGVVYGFILVWLGSLAIFSSLTELASMAPVSGGQYHWVSMMAPDYCQRLLGYIEGWLTVVGWQGLCGGAAYLSAQLLQALVSFTRPEYTPKPYQAMLLIWAIVALSVLINTQGGTFLPRFEGLILVLHLLGYFGVLIPLLVLSNHQPTSAVFHNFVNGGNWPTQGLSFFVGLNGAIFVFAGADGSLHMAEEIQNAAVIVPRSVVISYFYNGLMGLGMLIALLYAYSDLSVLEDPPPQQYTFIEVYLQVTHSVAGTAVMVSLLLIMQFCATVSVQTSASRMLWSFSRDKGVPGWRILQKLSPHSTYPVYCIALTSTITCLLSLINLGSSVALNDVLSISVAGLYASYLVALSLLLYRRCTGGIRYHSDEKLANTGGAQLVWGPWHLPGVFGIAVNAVSCAYLTMAWFFAFWPTELPVTAKDMNYSSLILGTIVIFSMYYYYAMGRREYKGPIVEEIKDVGDGWDE